MTKAEEAYLCTICGNKVKVLEAGKGTLVFLSISFIMTYVTRLCHYLQNKSCGSMRAGVKILARVR